MLWPAGVVRVARRSDDGVDRLVAGDVPSSVGGIRVPQAPEVRRFSVPVRVCRRPVLARGCRRIQGDASGGSRADVDFLVPCGDGRVVVEDEVSDHRLGDRDLSAGVAGGAHDVGRDAGVACDETRSLTIRGRRETCGRGDDRDDRHHYQYCEPGLLQLPPPSFLQSALLFHFTTK